MQEVINNCDTFLQTKYKRVLLKTELTLMPTASRPMEMLSINTVSFNKTKFLTVIDMFSRHLQLYKITSRQATKISDKLINHFNSYGVLN